MALRLIRIVNCSVEPYDNYRELYFNRIVFPEYELTMTIEYFYNCVLQHQKIYRSIFRADNYDKETILRHFRQPANLVFHWNTGDAEKLDIEDDGLPPDIEISDEAMRIIEYITEGQPKKLFNKLLEYDNNSAGS